MAGLGNSPDQFVVRGDPSDNSFSVFLYANGTLQSAESVNSPKDHMIARKLLTAGVSPSAEQAANIDFALKSLLD